MTDINDIKAKAIEYAKNAIVGDADLKTMALLIAGETGNLIFKYLEQQGIQLVKGESFDSRKMLDDFRAYKEKRGVSAWKKEDRVICEDAYTEGWLDGHGAVFQLSYMKEREALLKAAQPPQAENGGEG